MHRHFSHLNHLPAVTIIAMVVVTGCSQPPENDPSTRIQDMGDSQYSIPEAHDDKAIMRQIKAEIAFCTKHGKVLATGESSTRHPDQMYFTCEVPNAHEEPYGIR